MSPVKNKPIKTLRRKAGDGIHLRPTGTYGHRSPLEQRQEEARERVQAKGHGYAAPRRNPVAAVTDPARHAVSAEQLQQAGITPQLAQALTSDRVKASAIDPDTLQLFMALMEPMLERLGKEVRKPSLAEEKKQAEEIERFRQQRVRAAEDGQRNREATIAYQSACTHTKDNGEHRWRGQVHSDGWAVVRCLMCLLQYRVRVTPQMMQTGLNLGEIRGLTHQHIKNWATESLALDQRIRAAEAQMKQATAGAQFNPMEPSPLPI